MKKQLRICEKCNSEIETNQNFCPVCGVKVEPKKLSKKAKATMVGAAGVVAIAGIAAALFLVPAVKKQNVYKEAVSCYTNGQFEQAQELFESLGEYKDSRQKATDACVGRAEGFLADEDFDNAREILKSVEENDSVKNMEKQCDYKEAEILVKNEEYAKADVLYTKLAKEGYKDADKLEKEVRPKAADELYENLLHEQWKKISNEYQEVEYIANDFNGDGINEILLHLTGDKYLAYSYSSKTGKVEKIGTLNSIISFAYYYEKEHLLSTVDFNGEDVSYSFYFQFEDGKFTEITDKIESGEISDDEYTDGKSLMPLEYEPGQRVSEWCVNGKWEIDKFTVNGYKLEEASTGLTLEFKGGKVCMIEDVGDKKTNNEYEFTLEGNKVIMEDLIGTVDGNTLKFKSSKKDEYEMVFYRK